MSLGTVRTLPERARTGQNIPRHCAFVDAVIPLLQNLQGR